MSELEPGDKRSAFMGMIVTAILLFFLAFGLVQWTNAKFASQPHGAETKH